MPKKEVFLYLQTTGHISGKPHTIEIWYVTHEGRHYLVAETRERAHWVQNLQHDPNIIYWIGKAGARIPGTGRVINEAEEPQLSEAVKALMGAKYNWSNGLIVELSPA